MKCIECGSEMRVELETPVVLYPDTTPPVRTIQTTSVCDRCGQQALNVTTLPDNNRTQDPQNPK